MNKTILMNAFHANLKQFNAMLKNKIVNYNQLRQLAKGINQLGGIIWGLCYRMPTTVRNYLHPVRQPVARPAQVMHNPVINPALAAQIKSQMTNNFPKAAIPANCTPAPNLLVGVNNVKSAVKAQAKLNASPRPARTIQVNVGLCRNAAMPTGFSGVWDQAMEDAFNMGNFRYLRAMGFTDEQRWALAYKRDVNSRENQPVKLKTNRALYYFCHADAFKDLIAGNHTRILNDYDTRADRMETWVKEHLTGIFEWDGLNNPLKKVCNLSTIEWSLGRRGKVITYKYAI